MVDIIVVGTIGIDSVKTPFGNVKDVLGGSSIYASYAASFFADIGICSIVGSDFPDEFMQLLKRRGLNTSGIQLDGKTFRWSGEYEYDMCEATTLITELNCLSEFKAELPDDYKKAKFCFLANTDPDIQLKVISQLKKPQLIVMDTMNYWISSKKDKVIEAAKKAHIFVINDREARQLFETVSLVDAAQKAKKMGIRTIIIKKGEHGALLFANGKFFNALGYPLEVIKDPTGCGDSFAGGLIGYLAKTKNLEEENLRKAVIYGSVIASFNAEDFSLDRMKKLTMGEIEERYKEFEEIVKF
jgi:sugar/nucleoside kinase (ribokinase family)